ncbi:Glycosyl hydrolases family 2, sugar binding domain [Lutibacter agarilyticus]|uniref:Glycosyl hydrolases family 2, sugar binding domain n=1 Tax=Lutibacter agarilyticus TaxID=1109740 RepID=A0A238YK50_9FLAO|nr:glycosyl hydrolase [Lutibacter agarilyticus]SNR71555.1 Glycosyl hydrolases family 2, sugar binding domain [Lutibacter agarilyticus]
MKQTIYSLILLFFCFSIQAQNLGEINLEDNFQNPPNEAKARTWWHWISGNVSKSGITKDLEAMKQVGIQEAQLFNVHLGFPEGPVKYMSEEWLELFHYSAKEAQRLGLELTFHNSAGWSSSGGPWVTPENAMQTVVFSELTVEGGNQFHSQLPKPKTKFDFYKDIAIVAFPKPKDSLKIDGLDYKILSNRIRNHLLPDTKEISEAAIVKKESIINITSKFSSEGVLEWNVPEGEWIILRIGHTANGAKNRPAPAGGQGLEVDKMSKTALDKYWNAGIQPILNKLGDLVGTTVNNCLIDSYEVGSQNWTTGFEDEFEKLRGYSLLSYLPTLAGYYVDSGEITERFQWDFRRTIGDLIAENYYGHFSELCHKNNLKFSVEPYWGPFDNMQVGDKGDIVMCEFWSGGYPFFDSSKFVSSIAHLNGSSIVGAESFTGIGGWDKHPATIKSIGDKAWAEGITRFIFHTYVHQPWDVGPGMALSYHGFDFNRLNTWWTQSKSYLDYIAKSQYLLQQGNNVADVLFFTGDSSPNTAFLLPELKKSGYDYDLIGANKLAELSVKDGKIVTKFGVAYEVLLLPKSDWITEKTLKIIASLVHKGAKVIGAKPTQSPSLTNYPQNDAYIKTTAQALWDSNLIQNISVEEFLNNNKISPDFSIEEGNATDISFIHRKTANAAIYFIANAKKESTTFTARFRILNKQPELWNSETGEIKELAVWETNADGTTSIPLTLDSKASVFVVFRENSASESHIVKANMSLEKPKAVALSNLKIIKAEYGNFLQEGLIDITDKVVKEVHNGKLNFQMSRGFCDCDPAMGYVKEFRLAYQIGDEIKYIHAEEREFVTIDAGDKELKIISAIFGKFKPETKGVPKNFEAFDVTEKIKKQVVSEIYNIKISDDLVEGKTLKNNNNFLKITFETDGNTRTSIISEGEFLNLNKSISSSEIYIEKGNAIWKTPFSGNLSYKTNLGTSKSVKVKVPKPIVLSENWEVTFPLQNGTSKKKTYKALTSWSEASEEEIQHFSGTAIYEKNFKLSKKQVSKENALELDLGSVGIMAEVIINNQKVATLWKAPFRVDITDYVKKGVNNIKIKITNLWVNRLIGDENFLLDFERKGNKMKSLPNWLLNNTKRPSKRTTFPSWKHWGKNDELLMSGLLGPVKINVQVVKKLK